MAPKKYNVTNDDEIFSPTVLAKSRFGTKTLRQIKDEFIRAYDKHHGLICLACKECGLCYETAQRIINNDPEMKERLLEINKCEVEKVEDKLYERIEDGDTGMIKFYLQCKGGYHPTEKHEIEADVEFRLNFGDDDD